MTGVLLFIGGALAGGWIAVFVFALIVLGGRR